VLARTDQFVCADLVVAKRPAEVGVSFQLQAANLGQFLAQENREEVYT
jgi:hypothetical protein